VPFLDSGRETLIRQEFLKLAPSWLSGPTAMLGQFEELLNSDASLGVLCDILSFALPVEIETKQHLLSELAVKARVCILLSFLRGEKEKLFPPQFSVN
jgi:hypothetical protein